MTAKEAYDIARAKNEVDQQAFELKIITAVDEAIDKNAHDGAYTLFMKITGIDSYDIQPVLQYYADLGFRVEHKSGGIRLCWDIETVDARAERDRSE